MYEFCKVDLSYHGRHDMAVLEVEIVVRTIEISGHDGNIVSSVLEVVAFAHLQSRNLRYGIFLVGIFQR